MASVGPLGEDGEVPAEHHLVTGSPSRRQNPWPKRTTLVPTGPLTGSTRMLGISFRGTALLTLYWTGRNKTHPARDRTRPIEPPHRPTQHSWEPRLR